MTQTGHVYTFGDARFYGSEYGKRFKGKVTGIKGTANGGGYWIVTSRTHYDFGDANRYRYRSGGLSSIFFALPLVLIFLYFSWGPIIRGLVLSFQKNNLVAPAEWVG